MIKEEKVDIENVYIYLKNPKIYMLLLSLQSCPTLCDPKDGSPLGSSVPGILQARILEWVAISHIFLIAFVLFNYRSNMLWGLHSNNLPIRNIMILCMCVHGC